jgi:hypothetical protein
MSSDTEEESLVELQPQPQPEVVDLVSSDTEPESLVCKWRLAAYQRKLNTLQVRNLKSTLQSLLTPNPSHQVSRQGENLACADIFGRNYSRQGLGVVHDCQRSATSEHRETLQDTTRQWCRVCQRRHVHAAAKRERTTGLQGTPD